jgi:DHA1 family bicyclomycin/chloramphenicol resistance-like MFS transporter
VEIYGFSVQAYGLIFACAGLSILTGAAFNRFLVSRFDLMQLITLGVVLIGISGSQLLLIAWLDGAPFWWLWANVCLFMFTVAILMPNAMVVALDPLPKIAGVASSIIGTLQNLAAAGSAIWGALIYNGSVRNSVVIIGSAGVATVVIFVLKPLIAPGSFLHHPDELARD